jgi:NADH-quinone oxidoreductase subunit E
LQADLRKKIEEAEHPREMAVEVMVARQNYYGYLSDEALEEGAALLGMTPLEMEELATFYDFIYRQPVGRYVLHVCDGIVCWKRYGGILTTCAKSWASGGGTTPDGMFTLCPPPPGVLRPFSGMLVNRRPYRPHPGEGGPSWRT